MKGSLSVRDRKILFMSRFILTHQVATLDRAIALIKRGGPFSATETRLLRLLKVLP
jgi:hypothetical protein